MYQSSVDNLLSENKVLLPPPSPASAHGEYQLGTVIYDGKPVCNYGLREHEFLRHIGIFGITGTGKSNVAFKVLDELLDKKKSVFVFDWKRQYRDLLSIRPDADVLIFGVGNPSVPTFQFNPLIPPPGIEPYQYLEHVCQIVASSYYCGEGVISLLRKAISYLYREFGVYSEKPEKYPTFRDVLAYVQDLEGKGRSSDWRESTLRSLEAICHGGLDRITNVQKPTIELSELLKRNVILELGDLGQSQKKFIIQSLLFYIYYYTMNRGIREKLQNVILIEEAHHILRDAGKTQNEPITDVLLKEIREFSTGVILIDQNPSQISVPALANNFTTVGMYSKHGADVSALSRAMFLNEQQKDLLGKLECGYGIVKLAGRIFNPFLVKFPNMHIKKGSITDAHVATHMANKGFSTYSKEDEADFSEIRIKQPDSKTDEKQIMVGKMLKDIEDHPFNGIASRNKRLRISPRKGNELVNGLSNQGLVNKVGIKEKSGRKYLLEIRENIRQELLNRGARIKAIDRAKDGGIEHRYRNRQIGEINAKHGFKVEIEKRIKNDGYIDQVITKNGKSMAIEIETGKSNYVENIQRDLRHCFAKVICVATNITAHSKIEAGLARACLLDHPRLVLLTANQYSGPPD